MCTVAFENLRVIGCRERVTREGMGEKRRQGYVSLARTPKKVARGGGRRPPAKEKWKGSCCFKVKQRKI